MTDHPLTLLKAPTGIDGLDGITKGGLPRGRPTLICGQAGTGKTLLAFEFLINGAALYEEAGVFISFEESPEELIQNVASFGFAVDQLIEKTLRNRFYTFGTDSGQRPV